MSGPADVVTGLTWCPECLKLRTQFIHSKGCRVKCDTRGCDGYLHTLRLASLVKPAMAAYHLGGIGAMRDIVRVHPRVRHNYDPIQERGWFTYHPPERKRQT